jgi:hypothetical protein
VIEYENPDVPGNAVAIARCPKHAGLDGAALYAALLDHNRFKNQVIGMLIEDGANPATLSVVYDQADDLVISGHGLDSAKEAAALAKIATRFAGKKIKAA